jgi:hypothetical protein
MKSRRDGFVEAIVISLWVPDFANRQAWHEVPRHKHRLRQRPN